MLLYNTRFSGKYHNSVPGTGVTGLHKSNNLKRSVNAGAKKLTSTLFRGRVTASQKIGVETVYIILRKSAGIGTSIGFFV